MRSNEVSPNATHTAGLVTLLPSPIAGIAAFGGQTRRSPRQPPKPKRFSQPKKPHARTPHVCSRVLTRSPRSTCPVTIPASGPTAPHVSLLGTASTAADALRSECVTVRGSSGWPRERRPRLTTGSLAHCKTKQRSTRCPFAPRTSVKARPVTTSAATPRTEEETVLRLKTRFPRK